MPPTAEGPREVSIRLLDSVLLGVAATSLAGVVGLRVYAALWSAPVVTPWDDSLVRRDARLAARKEPTATLAATVLLPHTPSLLEGRVNGYGEWLALGIDVAEHLGVKDVPRACQLVNVVFFVAQGTIVLLFAAWATRDLAAATTLAFLQLSSPIVFGMSRWVLTENHVLLSVPTIALVAAVLLARRRAGRRAPRAAVALAAGAGYVVGLLAAAREYAFPAYLVVTVAVAAGLVAQRRRREAAAFLAVVAAFVAPLAGPLALAIATSLEKADVALYFHPLRAFVPHVVLFVVGPALALVLAAFAASATGRAARQAAGRGAGAWSPPRLLARGLRTLRSGLGVLSAGYLVVFVFYLALIVWSRNRTGRTAIMPMLIALALLLVHLRRRRASRLWLRTAPARGLGLLLVALAWGVLSHQLFVAFDGGRTYAHAAYRLEYFNYPLGLRPSERPSDHVCWDECPYDRQ